MRLPETTGGAFFYGNDFGPLRSQTGGFGGGQIGANWQTGMFVFGIEADAHGASIRSNAFVTSAPYLAAGTQSRSVRLSALITSEPYAVASVSAGIAC